MTSPRTLHITNGDSAAITMRAANLGDVLPWRDVLHDGPVPGGLTLSELSRVRAEFLAKQGFDDLNAIRRDFEYRDGMVENCGADDNVVLWFEWDLYDQLQLLQLLDYFARRSDEGNFPQLEIVSYAGYLGTLPAEEFPKLYETRQPVTSEMLELGRRAWRAVTSPNPRDVMNVLEATNDSLPFLNAALRRFLEELPWTSDGLSRAERQLLIALSEGAEKFSEVFHRAAKSEERVYCGDASAADYLVRLASGNAPLVAFSKDRGSSQTNRYDGLVFVSEMSLTPTGRDVLAGKADWISLGGSDRWLGGVHLNRSAAQWRWDSAARSVQSVAGA